MSDVDAEVDAIRAVLAALEPLSPEARSSVLDYVVRRLRVSCAPTTQPPTIIEARSEPTPLISEAARQAQPQQPTHIRQLKEMKKPRSANEMAALVAYYLENLAPQSDRKTAVTTKDIKTYFKIADFPLPEQIQVTLGNAKSAGYFDAVGDGQYKLNAVGHNLVAHSMPRGGAPEPAVRSPRRAKRKRARKRSG